MELDYSHISLESSNDEERQDVPSRENINPWMTRQTAETRNPNIQLHLEIIDFYNYIKPKDKDNKYRYDIYLKLKNIVEGEIPDSKLLLFGSYITQLYLPNSDIDLVLCQSEISSAKLLKKTSKIMQRETSVFTNVEVISNATVSIIKFTEKESGFDFDITFNEESGFATVEEVKAALDIHYELKYLILLLKLILRQRKLNNTYTGGIGSFLLFCMLLAFVRHYKSGLVQRHGVQVLESLTLGDFLLNFLKFYGKEFNYNQEEIFLTGGNTVRNKKSDSFNFSLWSPQDKDQNIGNKCYKFKEIFNVFRNRYHFLVNRPTEAGESILVHLINPSFRDFNIYLK